MRRLKETIEKVDGGTKDKCGIILEARACTQYHVVKYGGIEEEVKWVNEHMSTKNNKDHIICVSHEAAYITALWLTKSLPDILNISNLAWLQE